MSGCASFIDSIADANASIGRSKSQAGQAMGDAVGIGAMQDAMVASLVYAQVFFAGGYAGGYENFKEGEGGTWEVTARDEDGAERFEIERALLRRTAEGNTWWLLRYASEDEDEEELLAEALLDEELSILKFRYRDPESGSIREWIPEEEDTEQAETEEEEFSEIDNQAYYRDDYADHSLGKEQLTVPAGRFNAEHILIEDIYVEENEDGTEESYRVSYEWWLAPQVPGKMVKYIWRDETDGFSLTGELLAYKKGYTTQLGSY